MGLFFEDMMYERQATATLGYAFYGGSEPGEVLATVRRIREGDAESWYREWNVTADSPTLVTRAENDAVGNLAGRLYEALKSPKELLYFTEAEGAGDHCEQMARSLLHQKSFDWLDGTLEKSAP